MIYIITGFLSGFLGVGLSTLRTITTIDGRFFAAPIINVFASLNLFCVMHFVSTLNAEYMFANIVGASLAVSILAYRRRKNVLPYK